MKQLELQTQKRCLVGRDKVGGQDVPGGGGGYYCWQCVLFAVYVLISNVHNVSGCGLSRICKEQIQTKQTLKTRS